MIKHNTCVVNQLIITKADAKWWQILFRLLISGNSKCLTTIRNEFFDHFLSMRLVVVVHSHGFLNDDDDLCRAHIEQKKINKFRYYPNGPLAGFCHQKKFSLITNSRRRKSVWIMNGEKQIDIKKATTPPTIAILLKSRRFAPEKTAQKVNQSMDNNLLLTFRRTFILFVHFDSAKECDKLMGHQLQINIGCSLLLE